MFRIRLIPRLCEAQALTTAKMKQTLCYSIRAGLGYLDQVHVRAVDSNPIAVERVVSHPSRRGEEVMFGSSFSPYNGTNGVQQLLYRGTQSVQVRANGQRVATLSISVYPYSCGCGAS